MFMQSIEKNHSRSDSSLEKTPLGNARWRHLLENRELQFWLLQLLGWAGWATAGSLAWIYWKADASIVFLFPPAAVGGLVISTGLRHIYRRVWNASPLLRGLAVLVASYLGAALWRIWVNSLVFTFAAHVREVGVATGIMSYFEGILTSFYLLLCWSGLYFGIKYYQMLQEETRKLLEMSDMARQAQLKMLRYQLNPHFLFNTLNAISTLILERETELANTMVTRLSRFLRYSLDSDPVARVALTDEIDALRLYLDIEQVRFEDRLRIEIDMDDVSRKALIPSLILQPLVENAVKYAVATKEDGGTIRISAREFGGELMLEVSDDGPGIVDLADDQLPAGRGVGLRNTRDRLRSLFGESQSFRLKSAQPCGLKVCLRMPFEID
jgi:two-component system LytT family sensor kinase